MRTWVLGFLLGILSLTSWQHLPKLEWSAVGLLPLLLCWLLPRTGWRWVRLPAAVLLGFSWALVYSHWQLAHKLPAPLANKIILVQGQITSVPEQKAYGWQFEFAVQQISRPTGWQKLPLHVRLLWKNPIRPLTAGATWQLQVQLKPPRSTFNPGEFDYEAWLFAHGIHALGYVRPNAANQLLSAAGWTAPVQRARQALAQTIAASLPASPMTGFIQALAVGVRDRITEAQWQVLRNTGTNHLMAIAGLHIGMITGAIWFIAAFIARRCGRLLLYVPAPQLAALASLLAAICYSALAGFALPTQRAVIMISVFLFATLGRRQLPPGHALLLALLGVLLYEPLAVLSASFWLSFSAVALILYGLIGRIQQPVWWQRWGRLQAMIAVGLLPWSLLFFQQFSVIGIVANAIAIPWVGLIVLPLALLGNIATVVYPPLAAWLFQQAARTMAWLWPVLSKMATWEWLQWHDVMPNNVLLLTTLLGTLLLLAPRGLPGRWLGIVWLLPLWFWRPAVPVNSQAWLTLLDAGQTLLTVVRTQYHVLVYDAEPAFSGGLNKVTEIIQPFLYAAAIDKIDSLILNSHSHFNNNKTITAWTALNVPTLFSNDAEHSLLPNAIPCLAGAAWEWDGVQFAFVYPSTPVQSQYWHDTCVLRITVGQQQVLLAGHLGRYSAYQLARAPSLSPTTLFVTPWQHADAAYLPSLLTRIQPHLVLSTAAIPPVVQNNAPLTTFYNTATCGAITVQLNGSARTPTPDCYRLQHGHYWNARG